MSIAVDNALILAAGAASRFAPLSYERPKGLLPVRGEVLIERQIRQLRDAGITEIHVVVGYQKEKFRSLTEQYGVHLIENPNYRTQNNLSSLWAAREILKNTYVCCSDNYFTQNPFTAQVDGSYYAAVYQAGRTGEWCLQEDTQGVIRNVTIGGENAWVMLGHTFWSASFSRRFRTLLQAEAHRPGLFDQLWERFYLDHLNCLEMRARHYPPGIIYEFDSLEELRRFDPAYREGSCSSILTQLAQRLACGAGELSQFSALYDGGNEAIGCTFSHGEKRYRYLYQERELEMLP